MAELHAAILTPIAADDGIDAGRLAAHARDLLEAGCDGLTLFGTTGEGASFTVAERVEAAGRLVADGIAPDRLTMGVIAASVRDQIALVRGALAMGITRALVLPPHYAKDVDEDGLHAAYAELIEAVADARLRLFLYHIPQVSGVAVTDGLVARLGAAFPATLAGLKDSAGDRAHTLGWVGTFPQLAVHVGNETDIPVVVAAGGAGTICGLANLVPGLVRRLFDPADAAAEAEVAGLIAGIGDAPFVPLFKAALAARRGDPAWTRCRAPYRPLEGAGGLDRLLAA